MSIVGWGHAVPAPMDQAGLWAGYFADAYGHSRAAASVWANSGISTRHGVVDPRVEDVSQWGTGARMRRYMAEAGSLGKEAVSAALDLAGLEAEQVGLFAVVSCTGYASPGLDITLAADLGMSPDVQRLLIGHMGCYAALPGLGAVADFVTARCRPAVMLCVELPSLHVQPADGSDLSQVVAHSLFSDAAAAVVLVPGGEGLAVVDVAALTDPASADLMTWDLTDLGFRMGLSPQVPDVLARHVAGMVGGLLEKHGLGIEDVAGWAVHPGGRRILEVVGEQLNLPAAALEASYQVLDGFGNCSSATVLLVLAALRAQLALPPGAPVVAMAFGPGLTLYAALLRAGSQLDFTIGTGRPASFSP